MEKTILVIEDEKNINDILTFTFNQEGYKTLSAFDGATGLAIALVQ